MSDELFRIPIGPSIPVRPHEVRVPQTGVLVEDPTTLQGSETARRNCPGPWLLLEADQSATREPPPEMFLRELLPLDVTDLDALTSWCLQWGVPRLPPRFSAWTHKIRILRHISATDSFTAEHVDKRDELRPGLEQTIDANATAAGATDMWLFEDMFYLMGPSEMARTGETLP